MTPRGRQTPPGATTPSRRSRWQDLPFLADDVSLDFVNTAGGRTKARDHERLRSFADAVSWAQAAELIQAGEQNRLHDRAEAHRAEADQALVALREQRESLHTFLRDGVRRAPDNPDARARVEIWLRTAYQQAHLSKQFPHREAWHVDLEDVGLDLVSLRLALAVGRLLGSPSRSHIGECERCSWLFLDTSPSHRRRWCSMAICGNRAKAERHHSRSTTS